MKSFAVIKKNLKLLARSKGSAMVVLLAPLLIVLIIGFGFSDTSQTKLNVGIIAPDNSELTQRYMNNLNTSENNLIMFQENNKCTQAIKDGTIVACIIFPQNFELSDTSSNEVLFYVDESRINLVHRLIASLSFNLNLESEEVSQELTTRLLEIMSRTSVNVDTSIEKIISIKSSAASSKETSSKSSATLSSLNTDDVNVDLTDIAQKVTSLTDDYSSIRSNANDILESGYDLIDSLNSSSQTETLEADLESLNASLAVSIKTGEELDAIKNSVINAERSVADLKAKLTDARTVKTAVLSDMTTLSSDIQKIGTDIDAVKAKQEAIVEDIKSFNLKNADSIVNPVSTKIEPISANNSRLTYSFPYLLMLIVLFVGIMLSSTIVFMEKDSRAFFRTFTTPARNSFFVWMTYLTSALVILVQAALVLIVVYFWLEVPVFSNVGATFLVIFLSLTVFVLIGMFVGHLFSSSEGITMSTIAIGAVMIFLSNLILPLETLSPVIQQIAKFNPYVIASENVRKAMLFDAPISSMQADLLLLVLYAIVMLGITLLMIKLMSSKYLSRMNNKTNKDTISVPEDHYLKLDELKITVKNIQELAITLQDMTDEQYDKLTTPKNIFADWVSKNFKAKKLAFHMRGKSREKAVDQLQNYLERR